MSTSAPTRPRIVQRRAERRERILELAAQRFAEADPDAVRLEDIADMADIARGTLYSHFPSKEALMEAIVARVLGRALELLPKTPAPTPREAIGQVLFTYVVLFREQKNALRVAHRLRHMPLGGLAELHGRFLSRVLPAFELAGAAGQLRGPDPRWAARVMATLAVPLLDLCEEKSPDGRLFVKMATAMLVRSTKRTKPR